MINYHPDENLLVEYASGSLDWALSVSVCAHIQLCAHCHQKKINLNKIGGALLNTTVAEVCAPKSFEMLMQRIQQQPTAPKAAHLIDQTSRETLPASEIELVSEINPAYRHDPLLNRLPKVIAKLLPTNGKLKWRRGSDVLKTARLAANQREYEVALQWISSGGKVVEHDHGGLEVTLVLQGSFSDERGVYNEGDFLVRQPGEIHRPTATLNQDCLCLSVSAAPVRVTGFWGHFINPFLPFKPA